MLLKWVIRFNFIDAMSSMIDEMSVDEAIAKKTWLITNVI